jgi:hypothetical protein
MPYCQRCRERFTKAPTGRPRLFCSNACRQTAYDKRQRRYIHFRRSLSIS